MKNFAKSALKWAFIFAAIYVVGALFDGVPKVEKLTWAIVGLALAVVYIDGSLKERIEALEYRLDELTRGH